MIFSGTEKIKRYSFSDEKGPFGILSYGTVKINGRTAYKAPPQNLIDLTNTGWELVGSGTSYIYVQKTGGLR